MKTYIPKMEEITRRWFVVDLEGLTLGRAATQVANILRGKNKPYFTPHLDTGDYVIVVNASKLKVSGNKSENKIYYHYSGYPGGLKEAGYKEVMRKRPIDIFNHAVRGMLPKNRLGRKMIKKLHIYPEGEHEHQAQKPETLKLSE